MAISKEIKMELEKLKVDIETIGSDVSEIKAALLGNEVLGEDIGLVRRIEKLEKVAEENKKYRIAIIIAVIVAAIAAGINLQRVVSFFK